jgi:hypothetical protein
MPKTKTNQACVGKFTLNGDPEYGPRIIEIEGIGFVSKRRLRSLLTGWLDDKLASYDMKLGAKFEIIIEGASNANS